MGLKAVRRGWNFTGNSGEDITGEGYSFHDEEGVPLHFTEVGMALPGAFIFKVSGVSHRLETLQREAFEPGRQLALVPEPANPYDKNAVAVRDETGKLHVGYVPKDLARAMSGVFRKGQKHEALCVWQWRSKDETRVGIEVLVAPTLKDLHIS